MAPAVQRLAGAGAAQERLLLPPVPGGALRAQAAHGKDSRCETRAGDPDPHTAVFRIRIHYNADPDPGPYQAEVRSKSNPCFKK